MFSVCHGLSKCNPVMLQQGYSPSTFYKCLSLCDLYPPNFSFLPLVPENRVSKFHPSLSLSLGSVVGKGAVACHLLRNAISANTGEENIIWGSYGKVLLNILVLKKVLGQLVVTYAVCWFVWIFKYLILRVG